MKKQYERISKNQIKRYEEKERVSMCHEDEEIIEEENICAVLYKYDTMYKPSHRYSTFWKHLGTALAFCEDQLLLFGGFGCEKYLGLAKYSIKGQEWQAPKVEGKTKSIQKKIIWQYTLILWQLTKDPCMFLEESSWSHLPASFCKSIQSQKKWTSSLMLLFEEETMLPPFWLVF